MEINYSVKITSNPLNLEKINAFAKANSGEVILLQINNTKGLSSAMLRQLPSNVKGIRVVGGYDDTVIANRGHIVFKDGETGQYYTDAVIYTINETRAILKEIEKIEEGIKPSWSDFQRVLYVYDALKKTIMYDPKHELKPSSEVRSLRGLVTKQTVCAGFSLMFKEFMDRQGIKCEYVEGESLDNVTGEIDGHAWNIVTIEGKKYGIDLTWDNTKFRAGKLNSHAWLGQNVAEFTKKHNPFPWSKTQNYTSTLSEINPSLIKEATSGMARKNEYLSTTNIIKRSDGTRYLIAQVGNKTIDGVDYYRYIYSELLSSGKKGAPVILYSESNLQAVINARKFKDKTYVPAYEECLTKVVFSMDNIKDSLSRKTGYVGRVTRRDKPTEYIFVSSQIEKPEDVISLFKFPTRQFTRSDGTTFIAQKMSEKFNEEIGLIMIRYDIFEIVEEDGKDVVKRNTVFSERDFFKDKRQAISDDYLSRERLDIKANESGGYIGIYSEKGQILYNPRVAKSYNVDKPINLNTKR